MALEDIFKALQHQAERDIEDVLSEARARAAGVISEAEVQAQHIRENHAAEADAVASARGIQSLNSARLEARRKIAGVRQQAVTDAFDKARLKLDGIRDSSGYAALFERLLDEALEGVEGDFDLLVDARDEDIARKAIEKRGVSGTVRTDLATAGGVVVSMGGGRVFRRNTLEDRFDKFAGSAQSDVAEILFS